MVALEAKTLKQIILEFSPRGHRFGLMRSAPGFTDSLIPPSEEGSKDYLKLLAFLDQFTEQKIFADFKDFKNDKPEWATTAWTDSGEIIKSRNKFLTDLRLIKKGFTGRPQALRHIEMIGLGNAPSTLIDLKDPKTIEAIIDSITLSNVLAPWLGVDFTQILNLKANETLRPLDVKSPLAAGLPPLNFPIYQPTSVEYRAHTATRSHSLTLPFAIDAQREAMIKSASSFGDTLQLQGIDVLGRKTRILAFKPLFLKNDNDTSITQLWAADPDRIAEVGEVDIGMRYGILSKGTYLGAGIFEGTQNGSNSDPNQGTPILPKRVTLRGGPTIRMDQDLLRLDWPDTWKNTRGFEPKLFVYDLQGRLVLTLSLLEFRNGQGFAIPLVTLKNLGLAHLVFVIRGTPHLQSFALNLGA